MISLFKKDDPAIKSHIKNLLEVAMSDGHFDETEYDLLLKIAKRHKVGKPFIEKVRKIMDSVEFVMPKTDAERYDQIFDLITMVMADGAIDHNEIRVCNKYAEKLGFDKRVVEELVYSISSNISMGHTIEETKKRINFMLKG